MSYSLPRSFLALALLGGALVAPVTAQVLYEKHFSEPDGTLPTGWVVFSDDPSIEVINNRLRLTRFGTPDNPGTGVARTVGLIGPEGRGWTNYVVETTFRQNSFRVGERQGILARWDGVRGFPVNAYHAYLTEDRLVIAFGASRGNQVSEVLAETTLASAPRPNTRLTLRFTLSGSSLRAELFDATSAAMGVVEAMDERLRSGGVGLQAYFGFRARWVDHEHFVVYQP